MVVADMIVTSSAQRPYPIVGPCWERFVQRMQYYIASGGVTLCDPIFKAMPQFPLSPQCVIG